MKTKRKTRRNKKGGFFGRFKKELTTEESLQNLKSTIENTKLKDIEMLLASEIQKMQTLRQQCIADCKSSVCANNDGACSQINDMISKKTDYEWGNLCNSISVESCKKYLSSLKNAEFYVGYVNNINNLMQKQLSDYKGIVISEIAHATT